MKSGKIYFLRRADGLIKIGYTANLKRRLEHLTKSHGALEVVRLINGDKHREKQLHTRFRAFNEYGEWFRPESELLLAIPDLEDGSVIKITKDTAEREWLLGERRSVLEARDLLTRLVTARQQRTGLKHVPAMKAVSADYGLRWWTIHNLHTGRPSSVTAHTVTALRQALIAELEAYKADLIQELDDEGAREAEELAARVAERKAAT